MRIKLIELIAEFTSSQEHIKFGDFSYFWGKMGAGKSTIVRLVDYCMGGDIVLTPALQSEFRSATLNLIVNGSDLTLTRGVGANIIQAGWTTGEDAFSINVPARTATGVVLPDTSVEVVSDLFFHLAGRFPPKIRRSRSNDESELERLSIRDLFWYCYLDQDTIDSSFFHLDAEANEWRQKKSREVLRYILGFHQEEVLALESQLEFVRSKRLRFEEGARGIQEALQASGIADSLMLFAETKECTERLDEATLAVASVRSKVATSRGHATESLAARGRKLALRLSQVEDSIHALDEMSTKDTELRNELVVFSAKFRRAQSARELLSGIQFTACPKCGKPLKPSNPDSCNVCGTPHGEDTTSSLDLESTDRDLKDRIEELNALIARHKSQVLAETENLRNLKAEKNSVDSDLGLAREVYDSAFVSQVLELEKEKSTLQQKLIDLERLGVLAKKTEDYQAQAIACQAEETGVRAKLKVARVLAERDATNLNRLKELFLDCLLSAGVDGILESDRVVMRSPTFLPSVFGEESGELIDTSFETLGSGGKKTLFKCCFAVAVHRLSVEKGVDIPSLLIVDSPMKNISERENKQQFVSFSNMLYTLSLDELAGTQIVLVDKELNQPPKDYTKVFIERHMTPDDEAYPPLIRNYRGK